MRALLLVGKNEHSYRFIAEAAERVESFRAVTDPVTPAELRAWGPDVILSYNYRHIVVPDVLCQPRLGAWNLHPGVLPFGRGAHPVFWALAEDGLVGGTVHAMTAGLDKGPVLGSFVVTPELETVRLLYDRVHVMMGDLFWSRWWPRITAGSPRLISQPDTGICHRAADIERYWPRLLDGWDTAVGVVQGLGLDHATAHG